MSLTRAFKSGNSQAVRIPKEFQYPNLNTALEIDKVGDELHIRPVRKKLVGVLKKFAQFSADFSILREEPNLETPRKKL